MKILSPTMKVLDRLGGRVPIQRDPRWESGLRREGGRVGNAFAVANRGMKDACTHH